jgi:hypothetical protein
MTGRHARVVYNIDPPQELVRCESSNIPHPMTGACEYPHNAGYADDLTRDRIPSMTAVETLDPREGSLA